MGNRWKMENSVLKVKPRTMTPPRGSAVEHSCSACLRQGLREGAFVFYCCITSRHSRNERTPTCLPSDSPVIYILLHLLYLLLFIGGRTVPLPPQSGVVEVCELTDNSHIPGGKTIIYMHVGPLITVCIAA